MRAAFHLTDRSRVLDLGCGPGLYASRLAEAGIEVTGIDFSPRSIAYAREAAARDGLRLTYVNEDYLTWDSPKRFDLVTMIMRDYGALAPEQRRALLGKVERLLEADGVFLFDVDSMAALEARAESVSFAPSRGGGFWSPGPYFEFQSTFVYREDSVALDKFVVVEPSRSRTFYVWAQHFSPERLVSELGQAGLARATFVGDVAGRPFDGQAAEFAVVARRR